MVHHAVQTADVTRELGNKGLNLHALSSIRLDEFKTWLDEIQIHIVRHATQCALCAHVGY